MAASGAATACLYSSTPKPKALPEPAPAACAAICLLSQVLKRMTDRDVPTTTACCRYTNTYPLALEMLTCGQVNLEPVISHRYLLRPSLLMPCAPAVMNDAGVP